MPRPKPAIPLVRLTLHIPAPLAAEIKREAATCGRSASKIVAEAWRERSWGPGEGG